MHLLCATIIITTLSAYMCFYFVDNLSLRLFFSNIFLGAYDKSFASMVLLSLFHWTDRDLGLESPLMSSKPQSHSLGYLWGWQMTSCGWETVCKVSSMHGTLKEVGAELSNYTQIHTCLSQRTVGTDALRNCKFYSYINTDRLLICLSSITQCNHLGESRA